MTGRLSDDDAPEPDDLNSPEWVRREIAEEMGVRPEDVTITIGPDGLTVIVHSVNGSAMWSSGPC